MFESKLFKYIQKHVKIIPIIFLIVIYPIYSSDHDQPINTSISARDIGLCVNESKILPDVIDVVPQNRLFIEYGTKRIDFGTEVTQLEVEVPPTNIEWIPDEKHFYTLILTDPDYPTVENPTKKEWLHWLLGNIPGGNVSQGELMSEYIGLVAHHQFGTPHRYIFLLYDHKNKVKFDEPYMKDIADDFYRSEFSAREFSQKYKLGHPLAINYFINAPFTLRPRNVSSV